MKHSIDAFLVSCLVSSITMNRSSGFLELPKGRGAVLVLLQSLLLFYVSLWNTKGKRNDNE